MEMLSAQFLRPSDDTSGQLLVSTTREAIAERLRAAARGADPQVAQQRTREFFRSSGHTWSLVLA